MRNIIVGLSVSLIIAGCGGGGGGETPVVSAAPQSVSTTAQISLSSKDVLRGDNVTITWNSTNASSCSASGDWSGTKSTSGTEVVAASKESNTYTINCGTANASTTLNTVLYKVNVTTSTVPDYTTSIVSKQDLLTGINTTVSGTTFIVGKDGKMHVFLFPSLFNKGDNMPAFEMVETETNKFSFVKFHEDARLGNARSTTHINTSSNKQFVVVDTGLENTTDFSKLPYGHIYLATDTGSGFTFKTISTHKAFYHNVAAGDITGDNKDDLLVINMGTTGINKTLYAFNQTNDSNFVQDTSFAEETRMTSTAAVSSGSVATGDLDGDGNPEVVHAAYHNAFKPNWGAFRILKKNYAGTYTAVKTYQREGYFNQAGAATTYLVDIDNDKDLDIIFKMEGNTDPNNTTSFNMGALEIYRNDGNLIFTRMTESLLTKSHWADNTELYFTEISLLDFDNDGYMDIFLQQGGFGHFVGSSQVDLGVMILRNDNGKGFVSMAGKGILANFNSANNVPGSFRVMDKKGNTIRLFGFDKSGVPTTVELRVGK